MIFLVLIESAGFLRACHIYGIIIQYISSYPARACVSRSYVIGASVHLYIHICIWPKMFEWHFSGRLTFSNTRGSLLVEFID